jgi:hypothetical protein
MAVLSYLDAGSGSLIISALVAGFAGVAVFFRMGWRRFTGLFSSRRRAEARAASQPDADTSTASSSVGATADPRS